MSLDFVGTELFNGQDLGVAPNIISPSSSSITPSSSMLFDAFNWGENFIMPTDNIPPPQAAQDPAALLVRELTQRSATHSPACPPSEKGSSFVMTCPLPLCSHQSNELISIWRHITWDHLGDMNKCSTAMSELVEKVVLGAGGE